MEEPKIGTRRNARGGKSEWWDGQKWSRVKPNNSHGIPNEIYSKWVNKAEETYKKQGDIRGAAQHEYNGRTFVLRPRETRPDGSKRYAATPKKAKKGTQAKRVAQLSTQDSEYIKTMVEMGYSEGEAKGKLAQSKVKVEKIRAQVKELNKEFGPGSFSLGHLVAAKEGGGDFGRNVRLERGKGRGGNFGRGASDEIPRQLRAVLGIPSSGREAAIMDESGMFDLPLTFKDRQDIIRNPSAANEIITARMKQVEIDSKFDFSNGSAKLRRGFSTGRPLIPMEAPSQERFGPGGMMSTIDQPHERQGIWQR